MYLGLLLHFYAGERSVVVIDKSRATRDEAGIPYNNTVSHVEFASAPDETVVTDAQTYSVGVRSSDVEIDGMLEITTASDRYAMWPGDFEIADPSAGSDIHPETSPVNDTQGAGCHQQIVPSNAEQRFPIEFRQHHTLVSTSPSVRSIPSRL